jgi:hypothetical protein
MLHHPELNLNVRADLPRFTKDSVIDNYRDNWLCGAGPQNLYSPGTPPPPEPQFVTPAEAKELESETAKLNAAGAGPAFLAQQVIDWATAHPDDPRNPEALALAVKSSRFGCTDNDSAKYSEQAFRLLHTRYPDSDWTRRTPYWFK